jgi:hypothetical protein
MNRRDFFGAMLAGMTAALSLRFAPFVEWWERWFGKAPPPPSVDVKRFTEGLKKMYQKERLRSYRAAPDVIWVSPEDYASLKEHFANG